MYIVHVRESYIFYKFTEQFTADVNRICHSSRPFSRRPNGVTPVRATAGSRGTCFDETVFKRLSSNLFSHDWDDILIFVIISHEAVSSPLLSEDIDWSEIYM